MFRHQGAIIREFISNELQQVFQAQCGRVVQKIVAKFINNTCSLFIARCFKKHSIRNSVVPLLTPFQSLCLVIVCVEGAATFRNFSAYVGWLHPICRYSPHCSEASNEGASSVG